MIMFTQAVTSRQKRALKFALIIVEHYGYIVRVPSRQLAKELTDMGFTISFITVIKYWETLEKMGYVTRTMDARIFGVTYHFNRYAVKRIRATKEAS